MKVVADLHLHSKYSRAVSPQMEPVTMANWAKIKGIDLLGTSDWTHPLWLKELESKLEEVGEGIYGIKKWEVGNEKVSHLTHPTSSSFILSTEISSIYSQGGKLRRIHNVVVAPSFKIAHKINEELKRRRCNLLSDGRPIIGLSSIELGELIWSIDKETLIIPAHIWTPWFSMFGSKSGFDSVKECWGQFKDKILAVETGLSSDPAMNWKIADLDQYSIISNSDAHSPAKMGRELTVFELEELSFRSIVKALSVIRSSNSDQFASLSSATNYDPVFKSRANNQVQSKLSSSRDAVNIKTLSNLSPQREANNTGQSPRKSSSKILYTTEFYPEEGKYHYTGHRNCVIRQSPSETQKKGATCPVCGRPLTLGVMHRVNELASREVEIEKKVNRSGLVGYYNKTNMARPPYVMLVPLQEIIAEGLHSTTASQKVRNEYDELTQNFGSELAVLTQISIEKISSLAGERIAAGIKKVRKGEIVVEPGYDGVFGVVKIWGNDKSTQFNKIDTKEQISLF